MDEDELGARLARLHRYSGATANQGKNSSSNNSNGTALQRRLDALSGGSNRVEGTEENFNNRLTSLLLPAEGSSTSPTAEDLSTRLSRLSTGINCCVGVTSATPLEQPPHQAYDVPVVSAPGLWCLSTKFVALVLIYKIRSCPVIFTVVHVVDLTTIMTECRKKVCPQELT